MRHKHHEKKVRSKEWQGVCRIRFWALVWWTGLIWENPWLSKFHSFSEHNSGPSSVWRVSGYLVLCLLKPGVSQAFQRGCWMRANYHGNWCQLRSGPSFGWPSNLQLSCWGFRLVWWHAGNQGGQALRRAVEMGMTFSTSPAYLSTCLPVHLSLLFYCQPLLCSTTHVWLCASWARICLEVSFKLTSPKEHMFGSVLSWVRYHLRGFRKAIYAKV